MVSNFLKFLFYTRYIIDAALIWALKMQSRAYRYEQEHKIDNPA